jgi:hypothetical protein
MKLKQFNLKIKAKKISICVNLWNSDSDHEPYINLIAMKKNWVNLY